MAEKYNFLFFRFILIIVISFYIILKFGCEIHVILNDCLKTISIILIMKVLLRRNKPVCSRR